MIRALGAARPQRGDEVRFDGCKFVLTVRKGQPAIFHNGDYLMLSWSALKERRDTGKLYWVVDATNPDVERVSPELKNFEIEIGYRGERIVLTVPAQSEGRAKNSAVGKLARKLGVTIQMVWAELKKPSNHIRVLS